MKKFTFRRIPRTGSFRSFEPKSTAIKLSGKVVGYIHEQKDSNFWRIRLAVKREKTERNPAPFRWVTLVGVYEDEESAREMLRELYDKIQMKYDLHRFEDLG